MTEETLEDWTAKLRTIFRKHGVIRAVVFGSFARGEPSRKSDLDLKLIQDTDKRFLDRYEGILSEITDVVHGRDVGLLIYTPVELEKMSGRRFIKTVLKEGIVIYES